MRAALAALALLSAQPALAASVPWQAPSVAWTFGNLTTTLSVSGLLDTATGLTTIDALYESTGGTQASGTLADVERTAQVLVSGTPGNPFDPPVYETQIVATHDAHWTNRYAVGVDGPPGNVAQVTPDLRVGYGAFLNFYNRSETAWGSETYANHVLIGQGHVFVGVTFDLSGAVVDDESTFTSSRYCVFNSGFGCTPHPNAFNLADIPNTGGIIYSSGLPTDALPYAPAAIPEPGTALLLGLGLAGLSRTTRPARRR